jgi:hypothetical protein
MVLRPSSGAVAPKGIHDVEAGGTKAMMSFRRIAAGALAAALLAVPLVATLLLSGCRKQEEIFIDTNLSPNTRLTSAPAPYSQANYRVHLYWEGTDPDGYVAAYYFAWDDTLPKPGAQNSAWTYTTRADSLFKALIDTAGETRRHTFYVRAVDNEGKLDPSPAWIRFDAWTILPVIDSLYRIDGPLDPQNPIYNPAAKDTVLMSLPCQFTWSGHDPDGMGAAVQFSYRLDSNPFSQYADITSVVLTGISSGTHYFYVKAKDETGAECFPTSYKFVMNFSPDSRIVDPPEPSGTLTIADRDTLWFRWEVQDKEEVMGLPGGIKAVLIELDTGFQKIFTVGDLSYTEEWYFTSNTYPADEHYIASVNLPTGGNKPHEFRVYAKDVEDRFETPSNILADREKYTFWYNNPPSTVITYPAEGDTVCPDFTATWVGSDADGEVRAYQYVLDPNVSSWRQTEESSIAFEGISPGAHEFRIRARDNSDCWENGYQIVHFRVKSCK